MIFIISSQVLYLSRWGEISRNRSGISTDPAKPREAYSSHFWPILVYLGRIWVKIGPFGLFGHYLGGNRAFLAYIGMIFHRSRKAWRSLFQPCLAYFGLFGQDSGKNRAFLVYLGIIWVETGPSWPILV